MIYKKKTIGLVSALLLGFVHFSYVYSAAAWQQISDTVIQKDWKENSKFNGVKSLEWKGKVENAKSGNEYLPIGNKVFIYEVSNPNSFVVKGRFFANHDGVYVAEFIEKKPGVCLYSEFQNTTKEFPQSGKFFNGLEPELMKDKSTVYYRQITQPQYFVMDPLSSFTMRLFLQQKEDGYTVWTPPVIASRSAERTDLRCSDSKIPSASTAEKRGEADKYLLDFVIKSGPWIQQNGGNVLEFSRNDVAFKQDINDNYPIKLRLIFSKSTNKLFYVAGGTEIEVIFSPQTSLLKIEGQIYKSKSN